MSDGAAEPPLASPLRIFTMAINFILGAGILGLPYAVMSAGLLASMLSLLMIGGVSMLTSSWLLEVSDRANAVQNELSAKSAGRAVLHESGDISVLTAIADFCKPGGNLSEPLVQRSERKIDEYRAAYRSWRTGSVQYRVSLPG